MNFVQKMLATAVASTAFLALGAPDASAQSVFNPANGKRYVLTPYAANYTTTNKLAKLMGGTLVSVADASEQAFLESAFAAALATEAFYLGLSDGAVEGTFTWSDGTPFVYSNWFAGEPNNFFGIEDAVAMNAAGGAFKWNDIPDGTSLRGIVEGYVLASLVDQVGFHETFASNAAGWTVGPEWAIGPATVSGGQEWGNPDPGVDGAGATSGGVAGVVVGGNASDTVHPAYWLTSPIIPVPTAAGTVASLEFKRFLNADHLPYQQSFVEVWNGSLWLTLWATAAFPPVQDTAWTAQSFDVSDFLHAGFRVRFGFVNLDPQVFRVSQWNLDDVKIVERRTPRTVGLYRPAGPGSLALKNLGFAPGAAVINALTINVGIYPYGWLGGVDMPVQQLLAQIGTAAAPFVTIVDGNGTALYQVGAGVIPGITFTGVAIELAPTGFVAGLSAPFLYTTQ
jgi:hypothetical protein